MDVSSQGNKVLRYFQRAFVIVSYLLLFSSCDKVIKDFVGKASFKSPVEDSGSQEPPKVDEVAPAPLLGAVATATANDKVKLNFFKVPGENSHIKIAYSVGRVPPADCSVGSLVTDAQLASDQSFEVTGLIPNTRYSFRVCSVNPKDTSKISTGVTAAIFTKAAAPPPPTNFLASVHSSNSLSLRWVSGGGSTAGYRIAYQTGSTAPSDCAQGTLISEYSINGTSLYINGLTANTNYSFRLCAVNGNSPADVSSGLTVSASTLIAPPPNPSDLAATINSTTQITLNWTGGGGSTSGYQIAYQTGASAPATCYRGQKVFSSSIAGTSYSFVGLSASTKYSFRVCAIDAVGSLSAGVIVTSQTFLISQNIMANVVPSGPATVSELGKTAAKLKIKFLNAPVGSYMHHTFTTSPAAAPTTCGGGTGGSVGPYNPDPKSGATEIMQTGLAPNTTINGVICLAYDLGSGGPYSFSAPLLYNFTTLASSSGSGSSNTITEASNFYAVPGFFTNSLDLYATSPSNNWYGPFFKSYSYLSYQTGSTPPPAYCPGEQLSKINSSWVPFFTSPIFSYVGGFTPGQTYSFRLCMSDIAGYSFDLNRRSAGITFSYTFPVSGIPNNVSGLTATAARPNSLDLNFNLNDTRTGDIVIFKLEGSTPPASCSGGSAGSKDIKNETSLTIAMNGLKSGTFYSFRVCSRNWNYSSYSGGSVVTAQTAPTPALPPNPQNFTATQAAYNSIKIDFTSGGGSTAGYKLLWNSTGIIPADCIASTTGSLDLDAAATTTTLSSLTTGNTYAFRICAKNSDNPAGTSSGVTTSLALAGTAPIEVTNLKISSKTHDSIAIEWQAPTGQTPSGYIVTYAEGYNPPDCVTGTVLPQQGNELLRRRATGLKRGQSYGFRVCTTGTGTPQATSLGSTTGTHTNLGMASETLTFQTWSSGEIVSLIFAGDTNADGRDDYMVTAWGYSTSSQIYSRSPTDASQSQAIGSTVLAGKKLFNYGDFDQDGYDDTVITNDIGIVILSGKTRTILFEKMSPTNVDEFGASIALLEDRDSDGRKEMVVGAPKTVTTSGAVGAVYAISSKDGSILWSKQGSTLSENLGTSVVNIGDINSDGVSDFAVSGPGFDSGSGAVGRILILDGSNGNTLDSIIGASPDAAFGYSLAYLGDLSRNGGRMLGVGAPFFNGTAGPSSGKFMIYNLNNKSLIYSAEGLTSTARLGWVVSSAGDFNDDDFPDYLVTAPGDLDAGDFSGIIGMVQIRSGANHAILDTLTNGAGVADHLGLAASLIGDFDGDGKLDIGIAGTYRVYIIRGQTAPIPP